MPTASMCWNTHESFGKEIPDASLPKPAQAISERYVR